MSSTLHPNFHADVQETELAKTRRALQNTLGQLDAAQRVLRSREPKYAPIRTRDGRTEIWVERLKGWVPVLTGEGEVDTKGVHDAIRAWEMEGNHA